MVLPFLIHIPMLFFIAYWIQKKFREDPLIKLYWYTLTWKLLAGISLGLIYTLYYNSTDDTFRFHDGSSTLTNILFNKPDEYFRIFFYNTFSLDSQKLIDEWNEPRVVSYLKILSILNIITFSNYWINTLYLSLYAFAGTWILSNTFVSIYNIPKSAAAFSFLIFPSFVFWSSGVLKETFVIGSLFFVVAYFIQYLHKKRKATFIEVLLILFLVYWSWQIKFYYMLIALPTLLSYYLIIILAEKFPAIRKPLSMTLTFLCIVGLIALTAVYIHPGFSFDLLSNLLYENYSIILNTSKAYGKFAYEFENFGPELTKIIPNTPKALFIGLFRPFIWESPFNLTFLVGLENLLIMILALGKVYQLLKKFPKLTAEAIAILTYIFLTATLMALISPNWGTLSRYKSAFIPFWILFLTVNNPIFMFAMEKVKGALARAGITKI